jgi:hypothetical protein
MEDQDLYTQMQILMGELYSLEFALKREEAQRLGRTTLADALRVISNIHATWNMIYQNHIYDNAADDLAKGE